MSKFHVPINRILLGLIIVITGILIIGTYLYAFEDNPPVEFFNLPFPTDKKEYESGDIIILTIEYCRYTDSSYTRHLKFIDSLVFTIPDEQRGGAVPGCGIVDVLSVIIPEALPPGEYYLAGKSEYQVNFLAVRLVEWSSQPFKVLP